MLQCPQGMTAAPLRCTDGNRRYRRTHLVSAASTMRTPSVKIRMLTMLICEFDDFFGTLQAPASEKLGLETGETRPFEDVCKVVLVRLLAVVASPEDTIT